MANTTNFNLNKPVKGASGWDTLINGNMDIIDNALQENVDKIGDLSTLGTSDKSSVVNSVNEINEQLAEHTTIQASKIFTATTIKKMIAGGTVNICCYGDSITYGYVAATGLQATYPYPQHLQNKLRSLYNNNNINVINEGHPSWQSVTGLTNIDSLVTNIGYDCVILFFGINDLWTTGFGSAVDTDQTRQNIIAMINKLLAVNTEVALIGCHPINETDQTKNKNMVQLNRVLSEISNSYHIGYISLDKNIYEIYENMITTPYNMFAGNDVHFANNNYEYIANIVIKDLFWLNTFKPLIDKEMVLPAVYNPYITTDCTGLGTTQKDDFTQCYILSSNGGYGTYLNFDFFVSKPNMNLSIVCAKNNEGGQFTVTDNGTTIKTIDCYSPEESIYNTEEILIENLTYGYHHINILASSIVQGQSTSSITYIYLSAFKFKYLVQKSDIFYTNGSALGTIEKFRNIINGTFRFISADIDHKGLILKSTDCLSLKSNTTKLIIEFTAILFDLSGILWFGNQTAESVGATAGYLLLYTGTGFNLYYTSNNGSYNQINQCSTTINTSISHKIRIEHTNSGGITIFVDGTQILTNTDTHYKSGFCGMYAQAAGTVEIQKLEYTYI